MNRFPDFVRDIVRRLKVLCPMMGKVKIAQVLCGVGLHLSSATVGRMLKEPVRPQPTTEGEATARVVTAKSSNHVWHVDPSAVPISSGFWTAWLPFALPQRWPFCWWIAVAVDHLSRRVMGFAVFDQPPTSAEIASFLGRAIPLQRRDGDVVECGGACLVGRNRRVRRSTRPRPSAMQSLFRRI